MKKHLILVMTALAAASAAWAESAAFARATGAKMRLDTRTGTRLAAMGASETITYSPRWNGGRGATALPSCTVTADGSVLQTSMSEGSLSWSPDSTGAHTLTHTAGDETLTAQFTVLGDDVAQHAGALAASETWPSNQVHLVTGDVTVPSGKTLTIERGAVVKFMTGTSLTVNGTCTAYGVIFTHVNDDTAGGDTLMDGDATKPVMDGYKLTGNIYEDDATEERYTAPQTLTSSISGTLRLKGHKVYLANSSITVNSGATLTLLPGAIIKFASGCSMTVNGTLDAQGTRAAPIVFTSQKDDVWGGDTNGDGEKTYAQAGDWYQIRVAGTANFNYCQVLYNASTENYGAVEAYGGTVNFDNSVIAHTKYECVNAHSSGTLTARNSVFGDSSLGFGYYGSGKVKAYNCVFADLTVGIRQSGKTLANCVFYRCLAFTDQSGDGSTFKNCVFFNPGGFGAQSYTKCGSNGNIWGDPKFVDPDNGDFRIAADSPCIDAGDGTVSPELDYYGRPRMDAKGKKATGVPNADGICPDIGIYEYPGKAVIPVADLAVVSVTAPSAAVPGEELAITYVVTNRGVADATGMVRDQIALKGVDAALGGQTISAGEVEQLYSLAAGAAATFTARVKCPAAKSGAWLVGVTANAERDVFEQVTANNAGWASAATAIELEVLVAGESRVTVAAGTAKGFAVGAGVRVIRVLADATPDKVVVYGANGAVPTSVEGGVAAVRLGDGSWLLVLPEAKADEKGYVVIENGGATEVELKVAAEEEQLAVYGVAPSRVAAVDGASVTITGTGLGDGLAVALGGRAATHVTKVNEAQIVATFDLKGMAAGMADVAVDGGAGRAALPVEVYKTTQGPKLEAKLELPSSVRDGRIYTAYVVYANVGDEPMTMPVFKVERTDSSTKLGLVAGTEMNETRVFVGGISPNHPAGVLQPGDGGRIPVFFMPSGSYGLKLTHTKETDNTEQFKAFGGVKPYLAAMSAAATRLNLRGRTEYRAHEFVDQALWEKNGVACAAVSGHLRDALTHEPIANVGIALMTTNGAAATATTDSLGYFQLRNLADGAYFWRVENGCSLADASTNAVVVAEQGDINGCEVLAVPGGRIAGYVFDEDGAVLAGAMLALDSASGERLAVAEADENGSFAFTGLSLGTNRVTCGAINGHVGSVRDEIILDDANRSARVDFELRKGATVRGVVTFAGTVVTNGNVQAITADGVAVEVMCDDAGCYLFDGLPAGRYSIRYYSTLACSEDIVVELVAGESREVNLKATERPLFVSTAKIGFGQLTTQFVFTDRERMTNVISWAWDFDSDGKVDSTAASPLWTYSKIGTNTVTLVITEKDGSVTESRSTDCCIVEAKLATVYKSNAVVFGYNSGTLVATDVQPTTLTLTGDPAAGTLAVGMVVMGNKGDDYFVRRIVAAVKNGSVWSLATEDADWSDVYEQYTEAFVGEVQTGGRPVLMSARSTQSPRLAAAPLPVKMFVEGGVSFSISAQPDLRLEIVRKVQNGQKYERTALVGALKLGGSIGFEGNVGTRWEKKMPLPFTIETPPFWGITVAPIAEVYAEAEIKAKGELGVEGSVESAIVLGMEKRGYEDAHWLPPLSFTPSGSVRANVEGSGHFKFGMKPGVKVSFIKTANIKLELDGYAKFEVKAGTQTPAEVSLTAGVDLTGEANLIDWDLPWVDVKVGVSGALEGPKAQFFRWTGPDPDFSWKPSGKLSAPCSVQLIDESKGDVVRWFDTEYEYSVKAHEWEFPDGGSISTGLETTPHFSEDGKYRVGLHAIGQFLTGPCKKWRTIVVGKEEQEDDGDDTIDDNGGDTSKQSWDPNEMAGPLGVGDPETERFVKPGEWMDYTIYFENKADADVPAQEVFVDAQLSEYLDWSTFEMGEVAFNNQNETVLAGLKNGLKTVAQNGASYKVQLSVAFDETTGKAHWYMRSYDPSQSDYGYWPAAVDAGFLPPNDEAHRGEGHITYRVKVRDDAPPTARIDAAAIIVFDKNEPIPTDPAWWNTVSTLTEETTGRYVRLDLVEELGLEIPEDVDYAKGDKVTVKVEGLAKGLKVVATPVYEDPKAKKKVVVDYVYTIEGVPTEAVDFDTQAMYARVTVTYKDKTKGVKGKAESLQPVGLSIVTPEPTVLTDGLLNQAYAPADIAALWPAVADAAIHPKEWSFKGWPTGIKYNATTKPVTAKQRIDGVSVTVTNALPYEVYGKPTKAGDFKITATHAWKIDGKSVKETFTATMRVWADGEMTVWNGQAYVATTNDLTAAFGTVKSASGLPAGLKFTAKAVNDKTYGALAANTVYGKPTKAGTFVVTLTLPDPADAKKTVKTSFLWKIAPATAPTFALDTGSAPVADRKAQIVQGANQSFAIAATPGAKVTASGLPAGLKLVQDKATKLYTVQGVATKPGEYRVTFKTALNGVTTVTTTAFTVKGNPFAATYRGSACARPAAGAAVRLGVAEVAVAAAGTVKLTYTEGKTKYTASVKSFDWDDASGTGKAEGLVLKVSSADKKLGYGNRRATVTFKDFGAYLMARLAITDAEGTSLMPQPARRTDLSATVKTTEVPLPASQTFVFRTTDGADTNALATVSVAYDAKKATAAFSGKLYDGTAVKATVPVVRRDDEGESDDSAFAPFLVIAKDGTVYCFDGFSTSGGSVDWVCEDGEETASAWSQPADYDRGDRKFAELVPETGAFTFGWGSDAEIVGLGEESFLFAVTRDKNGRLAGVAIYDADPQPDEKPLATVTAKVGKATGAISVSFTSKKGDRAKYAVELVWRSEQLFAGHVTRTWKASEIVGGKPKQVSRAAYGTAIVK